MMRHYGHTHKLATKAIASIDAATLTTLDNLKPSRWNKMSYFIIKINSGASPINYVFMNVVGEIMFKYTDI